MELKLNASRFLQAANGRRRLGWTVPNPLYSASAFSLQAILIIPYVLLTLVTAMVGNYVVTRLVTTSVRERFVNQLQEAGRVAADAVVRREKAHLADLRLMAFTDGVPEALAHGDASALQNRLGPLALNNVMQVVTAFDRDGREVLTLAGGRIFSRGTALSSVELVMKVLQNRRDAVGDKYAGWKQTANGLYLFTSAPVRDESGQLVGGLMVGTSVDLLLAELKAQALADVILLDSHGRFLATTLVEPEGGYALLASAFAQPAAADQAIRNLRLYGRDFQALFAPLVVRQQTIGILGVVMPSTFVVATGATSRNTFTLVFAIGTGIMVLVGYVLARVIAAPISQLRSISQAVTADDLTQTSGIRPRGEIGALAAAFDSMIVRLRERTHEAAHLYAEAIRRNQELADANARLKSAERQLVQSEKLAAVGRLTAGIVHDVRNPLTIIKALVELLLETEGLSPDLREQLDAIRSSAARANSIVADLLKFSRQSEPELVQRNLRETIDATLRLTSYLAREARVAVRADLPAEGVLVSYDAQQIEQVLLNLIQNAIQAMPNGGRLRVDLHQRNGMVGVAIQDSGVGIPPENLNRVFDPFFTTKADGTGLGLAVSYGLVASHNGSIEVSSEVGQGTTFTLWLPMQATEAYKDLEPC